MTEETEEYEPRLNNNCIYCDHRAQCPAYAKALTLRPREARLRRKDGEEIATGSMTSVCCILDPSKEVRFACLEGNESGTYFRGSSQLVNGVAVIDVTYDGDHGRSRLQARRIGRLRRDQELLLVEAHAVIDNSRRATYGYDQRAEVFGDDDLEDHPDIIDQIHAEQAPIFDAHTAARFGRLLGARVPKLRQLAKALWTEWEKPSVEALIERVGHGRTEARHVVARLYTT